MAREKPTLEPQGPDDRPLSRPGGSSHARIISVPNGSRYLDTAQLSRLEQSFRQWAAGAARSDVRVSRKRILLIFLLIRYTGAKLNEVLALDPFQDINHQRQSILFGKPDATPGRPPREVQIPETLAQEIQAALADPAFQESLGSL